jgi:integrase
MKIQRQRYQAGSVRKVPRSHGFAWEFRFYATDESGQRKGRVQTFDSALYKTERDVRKAVQGQLSALNANTIAGKVNVTFGDIVAKYVKDELPKLKHSTQTTNRSLLEKHIKPKWQDSRLPDVTALAVKEWLDTLPFGPASKARARNAIKMMLDLAMLWEYMPVAVNPMTLVKVKGSSKRQKPVTILTQAQVKALIRLLPEPYNLMVLVGACLGLRVSETLALKWVDFDFTGKTVTIQRVFTHGKIAETPKTDSSGAELPLFEGLATVLNTWREKQDHDFEYVFASPRTASPYSDSTILADYIKPAAAKLGLKSVGWHTLRHSYKSWLGANGVNPSTMKDLLRHSDIGTTMDVYGHTLTPELRKGNKKVAQGLF